MKRAVFYVDGAASGNPGPAGIGVVLVGEDGTTVSQVSRGIGRATNNQAEYRALLAALELAASLGIQMVEVRSDSELMVRQLNGIYKVRNANILPLFQEALSRIAKLKGFGITHIPRERNAAADALARAGIRGRNG